MWKPNIISDLEAFSSEEWAKIAVERWQKRLRTYKQRLLEVIKNKTCCTKLNYWELNNFVH